MKSKRANDEYGVKETAQRLDAALRRAMLMPPKPHKPGKGKPAPRLPERKSKGRWQS